MAVTAVTICANALMMLGQRPIVSFDVAVDESDQARLANSLWPTVRDYVLRSHPWNCAIKRLSLPPDAAAPLFDFRYQFTLPEDYLRALSVGEVSGGVEYKIEGGKLLSDANPCLLRYVFRNEVAQTYDAMLVMALTESMRAAFSYATTQSGTLEQALRQALAPLLKQARAVDGLDDTPDFMEHAPLLEARYIGTGRGMYRGS